MTIKLLNNRYQVIQVLGAGGFGETFLAEDTHLPSRRRCVIKQLKSLAEDPKTYEKIQQKMRHNIEKISINNMSFESSSVAGTQIYPSHE